MSTSLSSTDLAAGIDLGTQGIRVIVADAVGNVVAQAAHPFPVPGGAATDVFEQDPQQWWAAAVTCLRQVTAALPAPATLHALAVTSTSGTLCLLDGHGHPTRPAIMYSDRRAVAEALLLNEAGAALTARLGYRFDASFALPKLLWVQRHAPETLAATRFYAHAADVLAGQLSGDFGISDWSHALKSGYDLIEQRWPDFISAQLGLPLDHFPHIVPPGTAIGQVTSEAAAVTGLPAGLPVVAGMTDGCAAQIAGGASEPGQWLSVLGTTLVLKGVTTDLLHDPQGRIYSHRHPAGTWLPGAASNTGGEVLARRFAGADLSALDRQAARLTPTGVVCYPLERIGERFPFNHPTAHGFVIGAVDTPAVYYTACLEGVGFLERLAYALLEQLGAPINGPLRVAGGGARSRTWLQIRANILDRPLIVPQQTEAAFGAAVLAASASIHPDLVTATRAMVHMRAEIAPQPLAARYSEPYARFVAACQERGYLVTGRHGDGVTG